ncbi:MAG: nitrous oxide-stimulated promoter family protein [Burkholderiales bacterium]|nr:nitrous oxide-stimulated promoter family protein [Burkholderiales bacterium]
MPEVIDFTTDKRFVRRARELTIIRAMVRLYCRGHDHPGRSPLCEDCAELLDYATRRLERCVFGDAKPTCTNCTVHCYSAEKREQIRQVMKWAGPRMPLRHPILSIYHMFDGKRPAPMLPAKPSRPKE